jgi:hypothetical protein
MAVTIPQRLVRVLIRMAENNELSAADRLRATEQLADCIAKKIGSRSKEAKRAQSVAAGLLG